MKLWEKIALNWVNFFSLFPPFYSGNFIFLPVFPGKFERGEMRKFFFSFFFQIYLSLETGSRFGPITIISCTLSTKNVCLMKDSLSGNSRRSIKMCKTSACTVQNLKKKKNHLFSLYSLFPTTYYDQISPNIWPK